MAGPFLRDAHKTHESREPPQLVGGAVVWVSADPAPNTGDTASVPWLHTEPSKAIASWLKSFGGVTSSRAELGQVLSEPVGTSEYPTLKYAVEPGSKVTLVGERFVNA
jgi:hypothetical protein